MFWAPIGNIRTEGITKRADLDMLVKERKNVGVRECSLVKVLIPFSSGLFLACCSPHDGQCGKNEDAASLGLGFLFLILLFFFFELFFLRCYMTGNDQQVQFSGMRKSI